MADYLVEMLKSMQSSATTYRYMASFDKMSAWMTSSLQIYVNHHASATNIFMSVLSGLSMGAWIASGSEDTKCKEELMDIWEKGIIAYAYVIGLEPLAACFMDEIEASKLVTTFMEIIPGWNRTRAIYKGETEYDGEMITEVSGTFCENFAALFNIGLAEMVIVAILNEPYTIYDHVFGNKLNRTYELRKTRTNDFCDYIALQYKTIMMNINPIYASGSVWLAMNPLLPAQAAYLFAHIVCFMFFKLTFTNTWDVFNRYGESFVPYVVKQSIDYSAKQKAEKAELYKYVSNVMTNPGYIDKEVTLWGRVAKCQIKETAEDKIIKTYDNGVQYEYTGYIETGNIIEFEIGDIDFDFTVDGMSTPGIDTATVVFYNLSDETKARIKNNGVLRIVAGYEGDYDEIFSGSIVKRYDMKQGGDVLTTVRAVDSGVARMNGDPQQFICKKGDPIVSAVAYWFDACGIGTTPQTVIDPGVGFPEDDTLNLTPYAMLQHFQDLTNNLLRKNGTIDGTEQGYESSSYIFMTHHGMGYFLPVNKMRGDLVYLDAQSGLISVTPIEYNNVDEIGSATCMLNPRLRARSLVSITSDINMVSPDGERVEKVANCYIVQGFMHVSSGVDFHTEIKLGVSA